MNALNQLDEVKCSWNKPVIDQDVRKGHTPVSLLQSLFSSLVCYYTRPSNRYHFGTGFPSSACESAF
ncbi:hypothetical protein AFLA_000997 [Aspergillus flavus NRRL3357]|nr:hypothetical protein AFLA_000997 [Aspergillus flavus NRRL3357]